ncbi:helix-turn-helix domain-containing protein [Duganella sp. S19_KUP01_CR8]|uniref:helix-turn-helix domain-containing protein n=1 Tax=Duganella sp. S19_KUP01_CR8 TaxID=3025502 RepID=UPI002FCD8C23
MQSNELAQQAKDKMETGALLTLQEVAAMLDIAPQTVHSLPLESIRLGRSLRFDPADLRRLINGCKEPVLAEVA